MLQRQDQYSKVLDLTAFELKHDGIDVSLIPDTAVGYTMANGLVNGVIVGADRILQTGHVFNKIGTYQVATMAKQAQHSILCRSTTVNI